MANFSLKNAVTFYLMIKKLTIRLKGSLYNKLRIYALNNDMTLTGAVRYLLHKALDNILP